MRSLRAVLPLALIACALAVPAAQTATAADIQYDVVQVPTVGGAHIRVEIQRDKRFDKAKQPVILTYSPYSSLAEPQTAADGIASRYNPRGYARAVADVIGTRGSSGCWDYGGKNEQQSGADVVRYLSKLPWSNGKVGMTGVSYEGTTANMVAALGDKISASSQRRPRPGRDHPGREHQPLVRLRLLGGRAVRRQLEEPDRRGHRHAARLRRRLRQDAAGRPVAAPAGPRLPQSRAGECDASAHTAQGYSKNPDYGQFWKDRDYRKDAAKFRVPVLVVHGWQDYNVKQDEGLSLYAALPVDNPKTKAVEGVPFKKIWLTQSQHADGSGPGYQDLVDAFWARTLKGVHNGVESLPVANSLGRNAAGATTFVASASWPPAGTAPLTLNLDTGSSRPRATDARDDTVLRRHRRRDGGGQPPRREAGQRRCLAVPRIGAADVGPAHRWVGRPRRRGQRLDAEPAARPAARRGGCRTARCPWSSAASSTSTTGAGWRRPTRRRGG